MTAVWLIGILATLGEPPVFREVALRTPSPPWVEISERTACEAMQDDYCLGRYGFTIKQDGAFLAGPSPPGRTVEGRLKSWELQQLAELIGQVSADATNQEKICGQGAVSGPKDQIDVTFADGHIVRAYDFGSRPGQVCYIGGRDNVRLLHEHLRTLMTQYYPVPFPKD
jgi:hypothetical protein